MSGPGEGRRMSGVGKAARERRGPQRVGDTGTITRRQFLRLGAGAGAGLVIGFCLPSAVARAASGAAGPFTPNAWIQIGADGLVTVTIDRTEMGQGVMTALPMILAEELEADWSMLRVGPMPENPAAWERRMNTGGSSSVRRSWEVLRKAAAAARAMLIAAAAQKWGVQASECRAKKGAVLHPATGRRLGYGELAELAATQPVPENPPLKDPKDFGLLGRRVPRLDTPEKVNGAAVYGIDVQVPGMLVASLERSPVFGGKVKGFDAAKAGAVPGVRHVVELEGTTWAPPDGRRPASTESAVAVVADTYWQALKGRRALEVTWDEGPNASLDSAGITARFAELANSPGVVARADGDVVAALVAAAQKVEAVYEVPFLHHATMEPMNCTADVRRDACDVWAPTQSQTRAQEVAAEVCGLPKEAVRLHTTRLGGGFGRRLEADYVAEAVRLSKAIGAPVKVVWSREDDVQHGFYRPATYNRLTAGLDAVGRPVAWMHRIVAPSLQARFGPLEKGIDESSIEGAANLPYAIPNIHVDQVVAELRVPLGAWRSVGSSQNAFVTECFFDELATATARDPYELRRELLRDKPRHLAALDLAARKAGWGTPLPARRGRGIAVAESFGSFVAEVAEVSVSDNRVRVHRVVCAIDCGPVVNPDTIEAQMEGGIAFGLTAALWGQITIERGRVKQSNFDNYPLLRMNQMPVVETHIVPSQEKREAWASPAFRRSRRRWSTRSSPRPAGECGGSRSSRSASRLPRRGPVERKEAIMPWSRRQFLTTGLAGLAGLTARAASSVPTSETAVTPAVLCSRRQIWGSRVNAAAWKVLAPGGSALDAVVAGARVVELDPEDDSVGYGGLPNEDGVVQLDASVMSGRLKKCGSVGALERIKTPSAVARLVMERSDHVMLVGQGALRFARAHGFPEENLLTERSRLKWLKWKENLSPEDDWMPPADGVYRDREGRPIGTINVLAVDRGGDVAGCTTTSGLAYKLPGRLGDSPIIGAGLYVDNEVGAAGATGRGEEVIKTCGSFNVVESMRRGLSPQEACLEALRRIVRWTREKPDFDVEFVALRRDGAAARAAMWRRRERPAQASLQTAQGFRVIDAAWLYEKVE